MDKFLWAVRLYKTRFLASKACDNEQVKINDAYVKAAKAVQEGINISVKENPIWRSFEVKDIPKSRLSAKLVAGYITETTAQELLEQLEEVKAINRENHLQGTKGRPTKKLRRDLKRFKGD